MNSKPPIIFVHGWAFAPACWDGIIGLLSSEYRCQAINLGNIEKVPSHCIVVGHSLGVLWAIKKFPERIEKIVSIAGFSEFSAWPEKVIHRMQKKLLCDRQAVLQDFFQRCDVPLQKIDADTGVLSTQLQWLSSWKAAVPKHPILSLHGSNDKIITPTKALTPPKILDGAGHGLHVTHAEWCAEKIVCWV